jgi:hypothetical protein
LAAPGWQRQSVAGLAADGGSHEGLGRRRRRMRRRWQTPWLTPFHALEGDVRAPGRDAPPARFVFHLGDFRFSRRRVHPLPHGCTFFRRSIWPCATPTAAPNGSSVRDRSGSIRTGRPGRPRRLTRPTPQNRQMWSGRRVVTPHTAHGPRQGHPSAKPRPRLRAKWGAVGYRRVRDAATAAPPGPDADARPIARDTCGGQCDACIAEAVCTARTVHAVRPRSDRLLRVWRIPLHAGVFGCACTAGRRNVQVPATR